MVEGMDDLAALVKRALVSEGLSAFTELLDPDVTWGAPSARNPSCKNRNQVLAWYQRGRDAGVRGNVYDVEVLGDRLLVSMSVRGHRGRPGAWWSGPSVSGTHRPGGQNRGHCRFR